MKTTKELWNIEYDSVKVIPSSVTTDPSKALLIYDRLINWNVNTPILDAGCGNGRNSIYFASRYCRVTANDYSESAINLCKENIRKYEENHMIKMDFYITVENKNLQGRWDYEDGSFGGVLDSYVSCHILDEQERREYISEIARVLRPGGLVYSSAIEFGDEYYYSILHQYDIERYKSGIVTDPKNGVTKKLYTPDQFYSLFYKEFDLVYSNLFEYDQVLFGKQFRRKILTFVGKKV